MAKYDYRCNNQDCKYEFEVEQRISDEKLVECPVCHQPTLERLITNGYGFRLKGKWFANGDSY